MSGHEFVQRGKVLIVKKQYQDAVKVCRLGLLAHPTLVEGRLVLGMALMSLGRFDEVLAEMRVALELDRASPLGYLLKGEALFRKGDHRQAAEVLGKAKDLDPLNEKVTSLLDEVKRAKEAAGKGARAAPASSFADPTETKAYPAHRGEPAAAGTAVDPISGSVTLPLAPTDVVPVSTRPKAPPAGRAPQPRAVAIPPPEVLAVGDGSGTIELDSRDTVDDDDDETDISDGLELLSGAHVMEIESSDLVEIEASAVAPLPPRSRGNEDATRQAAPVPADLQASLDELEAESSDKYEMVDLSTGADHRRSAPVGGPDSVERLIEPADYDEPIGGDDYDEGRERSRRISRALSSLPVRGEEPARRAGFGAEGPTNPETPGAARRSGPSEETVPALGKAAPPAARPAGKKQSSPFVDDEELESTEPSGVEVRKRAPAAPAPSERPSRRSMPIPAQPETPPPRAAKPAPAPIKGPTLPTRPAPQRGLPSPPVTNPPTPTAGVASSSRPDRGRTDATGRTREREVVATPRPKRTGWGASPLYLALIAVVVVVVAIVAGLAVRENRLKRRVKQLTAEAVTVAEDQTFRGYTQAQAYYQAILQERDDPASASALARTQAAIAAEFGEPTEEAAKALDKLDPASRDALIGKVYLALAGGDGAAAVQAAREAVASFDNDAEAHYLLGRALLAQEDITAATASLASSLQIKATPLAHVALGIAEAQRGRTTESLAAFDAALALYADHPAAVIEKARVQAGSGRLPAGGQHPETELAALLQEGAKESGDRAPLLSRAQLGWASLALAEVKLARGDEHGARSALAAARESRPARDARFAEALIAALLGANDLGGARGEAERALETWPARGTARVQLARIAVIEEKPDQALALLAQAGVAATRPDAISLRGQAHLLRGELKEAARDLEDVRADDRAGQLARATLDLKNGKYREAASRAEALYKVRPDPEVGVVYGAALRLTPNGDRSRARTVLEAAVKSPRGRAAYLELARLHREDGRFPEAGEAYARARELPAQSVEARLEAATLLFDTGDAKGARESIDELVKDVPADFDALLECSRLHVAVGDPAGATRCLDDAGKIDPARARWRLGRERGRLSLARRNPRDAATELKRTAALSAEDAEVRILLIDAAILLDDMETMQSALADVLKLFAGKPEADLARGRVHFNKGESAQAAERFLAADKAFVARSAPPRVIADARTWYGRAQYFNNDLTKAKQAFEEAAKLDPSNPEPQFNLGLLPYEKLQFREARPYFEQAVAINPNHADAWYHLGDCAFNMNDRPTAKDAFGKYLRLAPRGEYADSARRLLRAR